MHASTRQLIDIRDHELVDVSIREHVKQCDACRARLHQYTTLRETLRMTRQEPVPDHAWAQIRERRALETAGQGSKKNVLGRSMGFAASLLLVVGLLALLRFQPGGLMSDGTGDVATASSLQTLQERSRELEYALQQQPRGNVMSMHTAGTISELEDSIALIDYELHGVQGTEREKELWEQRVELMQMLMMVRSAQQYASSI